MKWGKVKEKPGKLLSGPHWYTCASAQPDASLPCLGDSAGTSLFASGCLPKHVLPVLPLNCLWIASKPGEMEPGDCQTPVSWNPASWVFFPATKAGYIQLR